MFLGGPSTLKIPPDTIKNHSCRHSKKGSVTSDSISDLDSGQRKSHMDTSFEESENSSIGG